MPQCCCFKQKWLSFANCCHRQLISVKRNELFFYLQSHRDTDLVVLLEAVVFGVWVLILLLFVCELGQVCFDYSNEELKLSPIHSLSIIVQFKLEQRFSDSISEMDDVITQYDWYLFPYKVRRILPMVMQNTRKPIIIKCFGDVLCARIQMQKVSNYPRGENRSNAILDN